MKITSSNVAMSSEHRASEYNSAERMTITTRTTGALKAIEAYAGSHSGNVVSGMREFDREEKLSEEQKRKDNEQNTLRHMIERMNESRNQPQLILDDESDSQVRLLRKILAALNGREKLDPFELAKLKKGSVLDLRSSNFKKADMIMQIRGTNNETAAVTEGSASGMSIGTTVSGTVWQKITAESGVHNESEYTTYRSAGTAVTEDGRNISFGMELSMSRSFSAKFESITSEDIIVTDPLIINIDNAHAGLSDVRFKFDLDCDGTEDEISFADNGSGFLALDKDGNGRIDDGSELFGTKSGDGFADLAAYDDDGNNWIDENDEIYSRLKVWTKDSSGNDRLMDLKEADVGAIYLGSASTEFSIKDDDNATKGIIRKTGIYLKESGGAGTIQHVDLAL